MNMDFQPIIDIAKQATPPTKLETVGMVAHYAVPAGVTSLKVDLESTLPAPLRKRGTIEVFDAASLSAILDANQDSPITVYVSRDAAAPAIVAVLNGHGSAGPGWGDFRAQISFRSTPQWKKWKAIDGQMMPQAIFAEFIEDNMEDIVDPAGAAVLEIATYLHATRTVNFKSGMRLSSGTVQFVNEQSDDTKVGSGKIEVPEIVTLALAPVFGLPPYRIPARFRYRLVEGKLTLGIKMQRVDDLIATIVNEMVNGVASTETRVAVPGVVFPPGAVMVDGVAPPALK